MPPKGPYDPREMFNGRPNPGKIMIILIFLAFAPEYDWHEVHFSLKHLQIAATLYRLQLHFQFSLDR